MDNNTINKAKSPVMLILGIETSCDETAAAVVEGKKDSVMVRSSVVSSQVKLHARWGGVVPNLASREHLKNITPVAAKALYSAGVSAKDIDLITVTNGPGLIPALIIGTSFAKTLAYVWEKPLLGIHHIEGHIYANFIHKPKSNDIKFPILCLVVSGGHTQLILMKKHLDYKIVGQTLDDAAGEAFDKVARILNIGYPGGPNIAQWAKKYQALHTKYKIQLPRPMLNYNNLNFSFSGLKTAVLYETKKNNRLLKDQKYITAMCREFQQAVIDVLAHKTIKAAKIYKPKTIMLAGGVSANIELRKQLGEAIKKNIPDTKYQMPDIKYSIDNAAMIAAAAYYRWQNMAGTQRKKSSHHWKTLDTDANLKLK